MNKKAYRLQNIHSGYAEVIRSDGECIATLRSQTYENIKEDDAGYISSVLETYWVADVVHFDHNGEISGEMPAQLKGDTRGEVFHKVIDFDQKSSHFS